MFKGRAKLCTFLFCITPLLACADNQCKTPIVIASGVVGLSNIKDYSGFYNKNGEKKGHITFEDLNDDLDSSFYIFDRTEELCLQKVSAVHRRFLVLAPNQGLYWVPLKYYRYTAQKY